ncbi:MAG: class I SAM-dependent methyltransferase [bacterium]
MLQKNSNENIWDNLAQSDVPCSRPNLLLTAIKAKNSLNPNNILGDLKGKKVLCLASGGGQQSHGFSLLGAAVTVVDFSEAQLEKDRLIAKKFNYPIRIVKSEMSDLAMFKAQEFDIVYQPYSINYIPTISKLFSEVARVTKSGGIYHLMFHNPFVHGSWKDGCWGKEWETKELWQEKGYPIWQPYQESYPIQTSDQHWNFDNQKGKPQKVEGPQEYKHTLGAIFNGLIENHFDIFRFDEYKNEVISKAKPGTWEHYVSVAAPWLFLWAKKR